jgi:hypothetical protein
MHSLGFLENNPKMCSAALYPVSASPSLSVSLARLSVSFLCFLQKSYLVLVCLSLITDMSLNVHLSPDPPALMSAMFKKKEKFQGD